MRQFQKTTNNKQVQLHKFTQRQRQAVARKMNMYGMGDANPNTRLRKGNVVDSGTSGSTATCHWPTGGIRILNCTQSGLSLDLSARGQYIITTAEQATLWRSVSDAHIVVWNSPWLLDTDASLTPHFMKIVFIVIARGKAVLPRSAWRSGERNPHESPCVVHFKGAARMDRWNLVVTEAFRRISPHVPRDCHSTFGHIRIIAGCARFFAAR